MTEEFLQEANKLLYEKIKGNGKSSKAIYKKLSQFFRLPIDDEEDFLLKRRNEILPCRYTSDNFFRKQSDRIMDISEKKLLRQKNIGLLIVLLKKKKRNLKLNFQSIKIKR